MSVDLRALDRDDDAELRAYWEVLHEASAERRYAQLPTWSAAQASLRTDRDDQREVRAAVWRDGRMVGTLALQAPLHDHTDLAYVFLDVLPSQRRSGVASALLEHAEEQARALGRMALVGWAFARVGAESPATAFAAARGFRVELEEGSKVLDLTTGRDWWARLAAESAEHHARHRLVTTWSPLPDELVEGYCRLNEAMRGEMPSGESGDEPERWDAARLRAKEARNARAGRRDLATFALDDAGRAVAFTELQVDEATPDRAFQSGTLVLPEARGHRLGLALKVASLRALVAAYPEVAWIATENADVNAPMNAINERLGFRVVERCVEVRKAI
ncbi:GNAT family N-acetyltransferase [Nocardioides anomalus]|uniref:GNAT family N-acetyltransferase n=1 Tax=Nocardioides anomalus TaxID=2712223 RepID=A0A6G6W9B7_9ACTN|nr:GNAT family N-acetyltransferase [Nocardioides anomalus]QIG41799.1 GNAT family N-acetyltransferase [Nocardioides anomalus]